MLIKTLQSVKHLYINAKKPHCIYPRDYASSNLKMEQLYTSKSLNLFITPQHVAPQGSPRTPAICIAATIPGLIVRILKFWFYSFKNF